MKLEGQKSKPAFVDPAYAAPDMYPDEARENKPKTTELSGFEVGDYVVYPAHGAGQVLAIENQTVAGASLELFVIYFERSKMTLRVPTRKATSVGMRRLSDTHATGHVRVTLSQRPIKARGNWSRLAQDYESKINSGDIVALAEVVRDLFRPAQNSGQSFSERQLYATALDRLSGEVALVDGITEQEAVKKLEALLLEGSKRGV